LGLSLLTISPCHIIPSALTLTKTSRSYVSAKPASKLCSELQSIDSDPAVLWVAAVDRKERRGRGKGQIQTGRWRPLGQRLLRAVREERRSIGLPCLRRLQGQSRLTVARCRVSKLPLPRLSFRSTAATQSSLSERGRAVCERARAVVRRDERQLLSRSTPRGYNQRAESYSHSTTPPCAAGAHPRCVCATPPSRSTRTRRPHPSPPWRSSRRTTGCTIPHADYSLGASIWTVKRQEGVAARKVRGIRQICKWGGEPGTRRRLAR
jgi:hypothetical protein